MKKLTAGILASLIGLVSANSADAAVASKAYVDGAVESLDVAATQGDSDRHFINSVSETDGKISAEYKDLQDVIVGKGAVTVSVPTTGPNAGKLEVYGTEHYEEGDGIDLVTTTDDQGNVLKTTINADIIAKEAEGNIVKVEKVTTADGDVQLQISAEDTNTEYTFVDDIVADEDGAYHTSYFDAKNTDGKTATEGWYSLTRKCSNVAADGSLTDASVCEYQWELIDRSYTEGDSDVGHDDEAGNGSTTGA